MSADTAAIARNTLVASLVVLAVVALAALFIVAGRVLLLAFGGLLVAVMLDGLATWIADRTGMRRAWALGLVVLGIAALTAAAAALVGPQIAEQASLLGPAVGGGLASLLERVAETSWGAPLLEEISGLASQGVDAAGRVVGAFSTAVSGLVNVVVVIAIGIYLAASPETYRRGAVALVGEEARGRAWELLGRIGSALRSWLVGQLIAMLIVGGLTTAGLLLLDVPLALTLGLIAFLFAFVPYIGPIAAFVLAVLVALLESPELAARVVALYLVIQFVESYLVTPLIHKQVVDLPPALLLFAQVLLGVLAGVLGVALSVPLTVVVIVAVQVLYVRDVLGTDDVEIMGN